MRIGQAATGRVITAAATIMILVFGSFLLAGQRVIAEFGVGLASAVFLDAFILRTVLVPAVMHMIGKRNWWLPRGLDRRCRGSRWRASSSSPREEPPSARPPRRWRRVDVHQRAAGEPEQGEDAVPGPGVNEPARVPPLRLVLSSPLYRGATIALFLSGLGFSAAAPQIASFLVKELGASLTVAGLFYLTSLTAPVAGYLVGARSDRSGRRLGLFRLCAVAGLRGLGRDRPVDAAVDAVRRSAPLVLGFAGAATSQLFAAIHDELARPAERRPTTAWSPSCGWR